MHTKTLPCVKTEIFFKPSLNALILLLIINSASGDKGSVSIAVIKIEEGVLSAVGTFE